MTPVGSPARAARGVALVTSGSAGIGRASVRCIAERGWDVGVIVRGQDRLGAMVVEVEQLGPRALAGDEVHEGAAVREVSAGLVEAGRGVWPW